MEIFTDPMTWVIAGALIMLSELIIPGGVVFFLGAACVVVAASLYFGLVTTGTSALTLFFISSLALIICLRFVVMRFVGGDSTVSNTEEILDEVDELVSVIETIGPAESPGVVKFRGTQWRALGDGKVIDTGSLARIVSRDNISLLVVPADPLEAQV